MLEEEMGGQAERRMSTGMPLTVDNRRISGDI